MRRRRLLAWLTGLALSAALLAPAAAFATATGTIHFSGTESRASANLCTGAPGTLTIVFSGVIHTTELENGTSHVTGTMTGTVTFVPDDPSQPSFTGHLTEWSGENVNASNSTITLAHNIVLHGSDGSLGKQHILVHLTVNANGTVTSSIDIDELTC
jgi:type 1 fimbria pilin